MQKWWNPQFSIRKPVILSNPHALPRKSEPVLADIVFETEPVFPESIRLVDAKGNEIPYQLYDVCLDGETVQSCKIAFLADIQTVEETYWIYAARERMKPPRYEGIRLLQPVLGDGVKRLDTGHYILELCRGTADGTAAGKWGIRYFEAKTEGRNLIKDCANAIGGFYGPFFTPANGLINPPEHTVVDVITEVEGPVYCRYKFRGTVPDGLDPNLRGKNFEIVWEFFYKTPWFRRTYYVDSYSTVIDGMPVRDKITVGDEFESGQGEAVFTRFGAYGGTYYRSGDRYARILAREVYRLLQTPEDQAPQGLKKFKEIIGDDINKVSWDYFWRLFCVKEGILQEDEIRSHIRGILAEAYEAVHRSGRKDDIRFADLVDVTAEEDQTIFPLNANKTVELNPETGYAMVWYTSRPVARYQIVQRPDSGWVNWGTNGENEYPELPIGSTIYTAYDRFDDWKQEADKMEFPLAVRVGMTEHRMTSV